MTKLRGLLGILTMAVGFAFYTVPGLNPGGAGVSGLLIVLVFLALLPPSMNAYTLALLGMIGTFGPAITRVEYSFDPATSTTAMCGLFFLLGGLLIGYTLPVRFKPSANQEVRLPALKWIIFAYAICGAGGVLFVIKRMDLRPEQLIGIHGDWGFLLGDLGPLYWASGTLLSASVLLCLLVATRLAPAKRSARVLATGWAVFVIATSLPRSGRSGTLVFVFVWIGLRWMRGRQRLSAKYVVAGSAGAAILIGLLVVMSSIRARPGEIPTADEIVRVRDPADLLSQNTYDYFFAVDSF